MIRGVEAHFGGGQRELGLLELQVVVQRAVIGAAAPPKITCAWSEPMSYAKPRRGWKVSVCSLRLLPVEM
jgi:hypothetical protein